MNQKELTMGKNRTIFKQGEKSSDLYFLKKGVVTLTIKDNGTGQEHTVSTVQAPAVLGTMSFLEEEPRSATATTKTEIKYITVPQSNKDALLKETPLPSLTFFLALSGPDIGVVFASTFL